MIKIDKNNIFYTCKMSSKNTNIAINNTPVPEVPLVPQQQTPDNNKSIIQTYDITKEENSKVRYLMSYYGY
jgi:hypothetical protein